MLLVTSIRLMPRSPKARFRAPLRLTLTNTLRPSMAQTEEKQLAKKISSRAGTRTQVSRVPGQHPSHKLMLPPSYLLPFAILFSSFTHQYAMEMEGTSWFIKPSCHRLRYRHSDTVVVMPRGQSRSQSQESSQGSELKSIAGGLA